MLGVASRRLTWPLGSAETASASFGGAEGVVDESFPLTMSRTAWTVTSGLPSTWKGEGGWVSAWCSYSYW